MSNASYIQQSNGIHQQKKSCKHPISVLMVELQNAWNCGSETEDSTGAYEDREKKHLFGPTH